MVLFLLVGCQNSNNEIDNAFNSLIDNDSFKVYVSVDRKDVMTITKDSAKLKINIDNDEQFFYIENNINYELKEWNDELCSIEISDIDDYKMYIPDFELLKKMDFKLSDDGYYYTDQNIDEMSNISLLITNDNVSEIRYNLDLGNEISDVVLEFTQHDLAVIVLPDYRLLSDYEKSIIYFENLGFYFYESGDEFSIMKDIAAFYEPGWQFILIDDSWHDGIYKYYPDTSNIKLIEDIYDDSDWYENEEEGLISINEFMANSTYEYINLEFFENLRIIYQEFSSRN